MAIEFKRTVYEGRSPEFWRGEAKILPGGFKPIQKFANGTLVRRGTLVSIDMENHSAAVCKVAKIVKGGTTKAPRVTKGNLFAAGDYITKLGDGSSTPTIISVDTTSSDDFDVLNLSAAISGLAENDILVESAEVSDEAKAEAKYVPNAVLGEDKYFNGKGLPTFDVAYDALVISTNVFYPIPDEWVEGTGSFLFLKNNPRINFIIQ